jgi:hypothetical protein
MIRVSAWRLIGPLLLLGCGSEPDDRIVGTYALVGVEGNPLPYLESSEGECDQFISEGELNLEPAGTYTLEFAGPRDCSTGQPSTMGRLYAGTVTQNGVQLVFQAEIQGAGTLQFTGTINPLEAFVTVPPIPPATGADLTLQFAVVP